MARKQSLQLTCRDVEVRMSEKRETIGDGLSTETDDVLQKELNEFDDKIKKIVREWRLIILSKGNISTCLI